MRALLLALLLRSLVAEDGVHAAAGVTVTTPVDWSAAPPSGAALDLASPHAADDAADRAAGHLAVTVEAASARDAEAAATALIDELTRTAVGFEVRESTEVEHAGRPWRQLRVRFRLGQLAWEQCILIAVANGRVATVCLSTDREHAQAWSAPFAAIAASLRWDPTAPLDPQP